MDYCRRPYATLCQLRCECFLPVTPSSISLERNKSPVSLFPHRIATSAPLIRSILPSDRLLVPISSRC